MSPAAEKGCPYCHAASGEECKLGCVTGPGIYCGSSNAPKGEMMVPNSVMVSQIGAAVLAERDRCAKIAEGNHEEDPFDIRSRIAAKIRSGE